MLKLDKRMLGFAVILLASILFTVLIAPRYPGSWFLLAAFNVAGFVMIGAALCRPISYVYLFLAGFLFLGLWLKTTIHLLFKYPFIEPVGDFLWESGRQWDGALTAGVFGMVGVAAGRLIAVLWQRRIAASTDYGDDTPEFRVPGLYLRYHRWIWIVTGIVIIGLNLLNLKYAFNQVGINTKLALPFPLNLLVSFLLIAGFGLVLAVLVRWEIVRNPRNKTAAVAAALLDGALTAVTTLSRSFFLFRAASYLVFYLGDYIRRRISLKSLTIIASICIFLFVGGIVAVSLIRATVYHNAVVQQATAARPPAPPPVEQAAAPPETALAGENTAVGEPDASPPAPQATTPPASPPTFRLQDLPLSYLMTYVAQAGILITERWIGIEGLLAVAAHPQKDLSLFMEVVTEDPAAGANSIYQQMSGMKYRQFDEVTFLTIPGIMAILYMSGSYGLVLAGMLAATLVLSGVERLLVRFNPNRYLVSLSGIMTANFVCQTNFPYLLMAILLELWAALVILTLVQRKLR